LLAVKPKGRVAVHGGHPVAFFKYDPEVLKVVKSLPGAKWLPALRGWRISPDAVGALREMGFEVPDSLLKKDNLSGLKTELLPYQIEGVKFALRRNKVLIADEMGLGKCIGKDTAVFVNGTIMRAEDIWGKFAGDVIRDDEGGEWSVPVKPLWTNALSWGGEREEIVISQITRFYRQYISEPVKIVELEDGSNLVLTSRHRLLGRDGWTNTFKVGDYVSVPAKLVWNGERCDPELVKFLAWQIADGYEENNRATVKITKNLEKLEYIRRIAELVGQKYSVCMGKMSIKLRPMRAPALIIHSSGYKELLEGMGYEWGRRSAYKKIPDFIVSSDKDTAALFLREYFTAEGSVSKNARTIEICSASEWLIKQLSCMLRRFGIWMRISAKKKRATNGRKIYRPYWYGIIGGNSVRRFLENIGFSDPQKQLRLEEICSVCPNTNVEGIPVADYLSEVVQVVGLPYRHFGIPNKGYISGIEKPSRPMLGRIIDSMNKIISGEAEAEYRRNPRTKWTDRVLGLYARLPVEKLKDIVKKMELIAGRDVYFCRIKSIKEVFYEGWVYDFEVQSYHNFVAENVLCHNTAQALAFLQARKDLRPAVVVCPASLKLNWLRECEKFLEDCPENSAVILSGRNPEKVQAGILIINYDILDAWVEYLKPRAVIGDEAHYIKNSKAARSKAFKKICKKAEAILLLTGTPVLNRPIELFNILNILAPHEFNNYIAFGKRYCAGHQREVVVRGGGRRLIWDFSGRSHLDELNLRLKSTVMIRRLKKDVLTDLPPKRIAVIPVEITNAESYLKAEEDFIEWLMEKVRDGVYDGKRLSAALKAEAMVKIEYLKQIAALGKLKPAVEWIQDFLESGEKLVVFAHHREIINRLAKEFPGCAVVAGDSKDRMAQVDRFQNDPKCRLFIGSIQAAGVGLSLTAASNVAFLEYPWRPADFDQAIDRSHRLGQRSSVTAWCLVASADGVKTIDERILSVLSVKRGTADAVLDGKVRRGSDAFEEIIKSALR
jgi:intein/homing endonuclease